MRSRAKFSVIGVAAMLSATTAFAQQDQAGQGRRAAWEAVRSACATDVKTYCGSATDRQSRRACIKENRSKFSDSCKAAMHSMHRERMGAGGGQNQTPQN